MNLLTATVALKLSCHGKSSSLPCVFVFCFLFQFYCSNDVGNCVGAALAYTVLNQFNSSGALMSLYTHNNDVTKNAGGE